MEEEYVNEFNNQKENITKYKDALEENLKLTLQGYEEIKLDEGNENALKLEMVERTVESRKRAISQAQNTLQFLRPGNKEDMQYRIRQYEDFSSQVNKVLPDDLNLSFHGLPIYEAKQILENKEKILLSGGKNRIDTIVEEDINLLNQSMPAGCIFVMQDKDEAEEDKLYKIITTPENVNMVTKWGEENGVDLNKVCDFDSFVRSFQ